MGVIHKASGATPGWAMPDIPSSAGHKVTRGNLETLMPGFHHLHLLGLVAPGISLDLDDSAQD